MGVCKCKQRNVTNQFCYVCRMNVCESCIVKDHQRCIIKSYVHWLQDSDYNAICLLCMESIEKGEVIRLTCYDIFHWDCFNEWALKHSEYTPASGYQCPDCKAPVFPPTALVSPVADVIRQKFATVGWGRRCMGLPAQPIQQPKTPKALPLTQTVTPQCQTHIDPAPPSTLVTQIPSAPAVKMNPTASSTPLPPSVSKKSVPAQTVETIFTPIQTSKPQQKQQPTQKIEQANPSLKAKDPQQPTVTPQQPHLKPNQNAATYVREKFQIEGATPHKVIDSRRYDDAKINVSYDHDDDKYKRKGFTHWFGNLLNLKNKEKKPGAKREAGMTFKRLFIAFILISLAFMTIIYFMSTYGRNLAASDPMLDPMKNPNIKVAVPDDKIDVGVVVK